MHDINIRNLTYQYKGSNRKVLNSLSLKFRPGTLNVVIGHNGAGKTTLFDLLTHVLDTPAAITGLPADQETLYQVQGILFPSSLTGYDLFRFFLYTDYRNTIRITKQPYTDQQMTAGEMDMMERLWTTRYGDMSVGERRYLSILAITLMQRKLYIFDEPTSAIDPEARMRIMNRIQQLAAHPEKLVIMSTHTLHELKNYPCRLYALHRGKKIFEGDYMEFLAYYKHEDPDFAFQNMLHSME
ncbi:ATP-binding cassette domain-containing protein [Paenibacillus wulumuqiensis]|uniref:ATP-binding cassette domain-containing protein n=1 Tax=Paenibacillus wulumuqiensis TaxID=1567107 RepID=UPI00069621EA|nr:AAA family ATPase [Paenibacillus wulumuqiensis]